MRMRNCLLIQRLFEVRTMTSFAPRREKKTYKMTCAPVESSVQPGNPISLRFMVAI